ncbi:MAG: phosphoribosylglycinamide formyltransferase [Clostridiales bacterium]|nr:phosphoribosylglycinamide formyltransferase [Clostridiales bacterium]
MLIPTTETKKLKLAILVSGGGTNLQAILDRIDDGYLSDCEISVVISNKASAHALERAKNRGIPTATVIRKQYQRASDFDNALAAAVTAHKTDLVVMAGFLAVVGEDFTKRFEGMMINIHPSLIPAFCGTGFYGLIPHIKALEYGVKVTGATVHFVNAEPDAGPIILQKAVNVQQDDTPEILQQRVMKEAEWEILPQAIRLYADKRIKVEGRIVKIT